MSFKELQQVTPCPKCGGKTTRTISEQQRNGKDLAPPRERIYCKDCGQVFVDRVYVEETTQ